MLDRPITNSNRCILVYVVVSQQDEQPGEKEEFQLLAQAAGAEIPSLISAKRPRPDARYFVGLGKVEEIKQALQSSGAELVIINQTLSPAQERNLETALQARVLDRTGLILDIFAQRARSFAGKLQVELAQLHHLSTRLVRGWSHLERQKGGIGLRGPGETQLETDRRLVKGRILHIQKRLEKVKMQRELARAKRVRHAVPTVALVGYTNAGKSTLFNSLVDANVFAADQLFATLDPTLRRLFLPPVGEIVLADTVGFIRDLPHNLIEAFHATLEETREADLLLHVIDSAADERHLHADQVKKVLKQIHADKVPCIEVYNKIDRLPNAEPRIERTENGIIQRVNISAHYHLGIDLLRQAIAERLAHDYIVKKIILLPQEAKLRAELYHLGAIVSESIDETGNFLLSIRLAKPEYQRLFAHHQ
ncbi:MAG: GTPase HflX [Legionellales bacterium]|nr:GTPase HflX [Legionellales bacterium]